MYRAGAKGDSSSGAAVLPSRHTAHVHAPALSSRSSWKGERCSAAAPPACACTDGGADGASPSSAPACSCALACHGILLLVYKQQATSYNLSW